MIYAHCSRLRGWRLRCACCIDRSCSWCICLRSVHAQCHGLRQLLSIYTSTWLRVRGQQRPFTSPSTCSSMVTGTRGMRYNMLHTCVVAPRQRITVLGDPLPAMHSILCWRTHRAPLSVATLVIHMTVDVRNTAKSLPCDDVSCQNTPAFPGQPTQSPVSVYQAARFLELMKFHCRPQKSTRLLLGRDIGRAAPDFSTRRSGRGGNDGVVSNME